MSPSLIRRKAVLSRPARGAGYREGRGWLTGKFHGAIHSEWSWRERVDLPLSFLLAR